MLILIIMIAVLLPVAVLCLKRCIADVGDELCRIVGTFAMIVLNLITFFVDIYIRLYTKSIQFM